MENLFARFEKHFGKAGYLAMGGQIVDATIVAAPKQRNSDTEKADIKSGKVPEEWKDKPAKLRQKDRDARWTVTFSKATADEEERRSNATSPFRLSATGTMPRSSIDRRHGFILDVAHRKTAGQKFHRQVFERFRASLQMRADLGAKRHVPARNLRGRVFHKALRRLQPSAAHAVAITLAGLGPVLAIVSPDRIAALLFQRFLHDQAGRKLHQLRASRRVERRPSIRSESDWRVRIDAGILVVMGCLLAGAGANRHGFLIPQQRMHPALNFQQA